MLKVYYDTAFLKHNPGGWHPESSVRLEAVLEAVRSLPEIELVEDCRKASQSEIELVHTSKYYNYIKSISGQQTMLDPDTGFGPGSFEASLKAAGACIEAVEFVTQGENHRAFCAVRPPGHHAYRDRAKGFCIFNNIAIAAKYALDNKLAKRIAIIDWDVHHGNGTQEAFYDSPDVLFISLHQYPFYPGTGDATETGYGRGEGYTFNIPLYYAMQDLEFITIFKEQVLPVVDKYKPDLMMMSAGFDGHRDDHLAGLNLSSAVYSVITKLQVDLAVKHCYGRIVSVFEGGYNLIALKESLENHFKELIDG